MFERSRHLVFAGTARLLWNVVALPQPNAKPETVAKIERRRVNRTLYCMLIALASPRGELEKLLWKHVDLARGTIKVPKGDSPRHLAAQRVLDRLVAPMSSPKFSGRRRTRLSQLFHSHVAGARGVACVMALVAIVWPPSNRQRSAR